MQVGGCGRLVVGLQKDLGKEIDQATGANWDLDREGGWSWWLQFRVGLQVPSDKKLDMRWAAITVEKEIGRSGLEEAKKKRKKEEEKKEVGGAGILS